MITKEKNIIRKQVFDLQYNGKSDGIALRKEAEKLLKERLLPGIEQLINAHVAGDKVLYIDQLNIDVSLDGQDWDYQFLDKVIDSIETELLKKIQDNSSTGIISTKQRFTDLLAFYFLNGYLPWWGAINSHTEWEEQLKSFLQDIPGKYDIQKLVTVFQVQTARARAALNLKDKFFWQLIEVLNPEQSTSFYNWRKDYKIFIEAISIAKWRDMISLKYKEAVLKALATIDTNQDIINKEFTDSIVMELESIPYNSIKNVFSVPLSNQPLTKILSELKDKEAAGKQVKKKTAPSDDDKSEKKTDQVKEKEKSSDKDVLKVDENEGIYIQNAGLVIVAPYLSMLFKKLGLVQDNQITDIARAIALMSYIVSDNEEYEEFETVLNKILAGVDIEVPLPAKHILTQDEKNEVTELLQAVIGYWEILKNTSVEGLRVSFLQREGKLFFENESWNLQVQQQSYDMLLQHLPWNISMIKLPWMKHLLNVNWAQHI